MEAKTIAAVAVFTALSVVLVLSPAKFPAPYAPFLKYQIWEIPITTAFLLYGPLVGIATSVINTMILLAVYPGDLPTGPLYNLIAVLSMLLGVYITHKYTARLFKRQRERLLTASSTALGAGIRVAFMSLINWAFLRYPYPIGFSIPVEGLKAMLPVIGLFNATVSLYTVPLGYFLAKAVSSGMNIPTWTQAFFEV